MIDATTSTGLPVAAPGSRAPGRRGTAATLRYLFTDALAVFGWRLPALILVAALTAIGEGVSMLLFVPLLNLLGVGTPASGAGAGALLSLFNQIRSPYSLVAIIAAVVIVQTALTLVQNWWTASLQRQYGAAWQRRLFRAFMQAQWSFFGTQKTGNLVAAMTDEAMRAAGAFFVSCQIAAALIATVVYVAVALVLSWQVTLAILAIGIMLAIPLRGLGIRNHRIGLALGPLTARFNVLLTELLSGAKLVKATASERKAVRLVDDVVEELRVQHTWATFLPSLVRTLLECFALIALALVLVAGHDVFNTPATQMLVVMALFVRLLPRFNTILQLAQVLATYLPGLDGVIRIAAEAEQNAERDAEAGTGEPPGGVVALAIAAAGYRGQPILRDVRLQLPRTGFVGIVGESGAGKSSLVNCLLGLCPIIAGDITMGSRSARDVPMALWRHAFGYVPQETVLFNLSVRDNIAWARDDATLEETRSAAAKANADHFIDALPLGYDTPVGDNGMMLSGGQRQRLGIARALLSKPSFLVLDEATSALDSASEAAVLDTLERLRSEICIVSVAHRLSSVRSADVIVVMRGGTIVEQGGWSDLVAAGGHFATLARAQGLA